MLYVAFLTPPYTPYTRVLYPLEYMRTQHRRRRCIHELTLVAKHPHKRIYHCIIYFCRINDTVFRYHTFFSQTIFHFHKRRKMVQCVLVRRNSYLKVKIIAHIGIYTLVCIHHIQHHIHINIRDVIKLFNSFIHMGIMYNCTILSKNELCNVSINTQLIHFKYKFIFQKLFST